MEDSMIIEINVDEIVFGYIPFSFQQSSLFQREMDTFCWRCHKRNNAEVQCPRCAITYHSYCIPDVNRNKPYWKCPECALALNAEDESLNKYIVYVIERLTRSVNN